MHFILPKFHNQKVTLPPLGQNWEGRREREVPLTASASWKAARPITPKHLALRWGSQADKQARGKVMDSVLAAEDPGVMRPSSGEVHFATGCHRPELARDPETFVRRMVSVPLICLLMLFPEGKRKKML